MMVYKDLPVNIFFPVRLAIIIYKKKEEKESRCFFSWCIESVKTRNKIFWED
jgi:hypothetical protein